MKRESKLPAWWVGEWKTEPYLDTEEAAALLKVHPKTLQRMARKGEVRGIRVGKLWRFRSSDLLSKSNYS